MSSQYTVRPENDQSKAYHAIVEDYLSQDEIKDLLTKSY